MPATVCHAPRRRTMRLALAALGFVAVSAWMLAIHPNLRVDVAGALGVLLFGPAAVVSIYRLVRRMPKLPITDEGFEFHEVHIDNNGRHLTPGLRTVRGLRLTDQRRPAARSGSVQESPWFENDEPDDEITETDQAFLALLRERTAPFAAIEPDDDVHGMAERFNGALAAYLSLGDPDEPRRLVDFGVHFSEERVRGDRMHNQFPALTEPPTNWRLDATGTIEELADVSADWFAAILRKPVLLYVWLNADSYAYAARFAFADTNQTLIQCYNKQLAPPGQAEELIAAGFVHGRGWIQTTGLPAPHFYLHIRGDIDAARIPPGTQAASQRGPIGGLWYEGV